MYAAVIAFASPMIAFAADAPVPVKRPVFIPLYEEVNYNSYVGVFGGPNVSTGYSTGMTAGYKPFDNLGIEGRYTHRGNLHTKDTDHVGVNFIPQARIKGTNITPYVLGGVAYNVTTHKNTWNTGGGVKYGLTERVELDGRYTHTQNFNSRKGDNAFTAGVNFKF